MIATVRIAPVERWCRQMQYEASVVPAASKLPGMAVQIDTSSMCKARCEPNTRMWYLTPESKQKLYETVGVRGNQKSGICEHMLEMD